MNTHGFRDILKRELEQRMNRNPLYSLRAFAKDLKLAPPHLSDILNGKRGLSRSSATKIGQRLDLSSQEIQLFCDLVESQHARSRQAKVLASKRLRSRLEKGAVLKFHTFGSDEFSMVADWYHFALLELMKTPNFRSESMWIAQRLGIKPLQAEMALERLEKLGIIRRSENRYQLISENVETPDGIPNQALRSHHEQLIQKSLNALHTHPLEERDFRGLTIRCRKSDVAKVRERLKKFLHDLDAELSSDGSGDEVYQLSTQFFQLTHDIETKGEVK